MKGQRAMLFAVRKIWGYPVEANLHKGKPPAGYVKRFFGESAVGSEEMVSAMDECYVDVVPSLREETKESGLPLYAKSFFIGKVCDTRYCLLDSKYVSSSIY